MPKKDEVKLPDGKKDEGCKYHPHCKCCLLRPCVDELSKSQRQFVNRCFDMGIEGLALMVIVSELTRE